MVVLPVNFSGSIYAHSGSMRPADGLPVMMQPVSISMLAKVLTIVKSWRSRMVSPSNGDTIRWSHHSQWLNLLYTGCTYRA
jgi:hypothetical protein